MDFLRSPLIVQKLKSNNVLHIVKFYSTGVVNSIFGYSVYAGCVFIGIWPQFAQLISVIIGASFNYFSYSRVVFSERSKNKTGFMINYLIMYLYSAALLYFFNIYLNPYYSGLIVLFIASIINFFILNFKVFKK